MTDKEEKRPKIYAASRASVPERPAMWRSMRDNGIARIVSTWIDEAMPGETADIGELWWDCYPGCRVFAMRAEALKARMKDLNGEVAATVALHELIEQTK